jgi:protein-S-isoprenylcysteine O-methyltransferase Ste14
VSAPLPRRAVALCYGVACHVAFLLAIIAMVVALFDGMRLGFGRLHGGAAAVADAALLLQFPLIHSLLLTRRGRRALAALAPGRLARDLAPTTYALCASLQLLATFLLWSPSGAVLFEAHGALRAASVTAFAGAWLFLIVAIRDGDTRVQTGWIGWTAVWRGVRPEYGPLRDRGLFALCRQPIYLGFAATLWTGPVWTVDHLAIAVVWTTYCVLGPLHKERRYARIHGAEFDAYRLRVPYMLPGLSIAARRRTSR